MNRIFKVIWNKTTQRQEVVSELAKGAVKASSTSSSEKNNKTLSVSILATLITSTLASSVSYAATINYNDIPKQGVAVVYDANSGILKHMSLEGIENPGVLSAVDATNSLNKMLDRYKGFFHVNAEGNKIGDEQANGSKYTENTGIWADWLTATASKVEAETKFSGGTFNNNLGKFTEKSGAQGSRSVAVGVYANALAADSIAIGSRANVNNYWGNQYREALNGIAIGRQAQVEGATNSIAFGTNAKLLASTPYSLKPDNSIAIGNNSTVNWASNAITLGNNASITGSHAVNGAWKGSDNSIAIGNETTVGREDTVAIGSNVNAQRENTVAIGTNVTAKGENSVVIGQNAKGESARGVAIGAYAIAKGDRTVAIGPEATANGSKSIVIGGIGDAKAKAIAEKEQAIVIGNGAQATDNATYSVTLGNNAKTAGATGISIGDRAQVVASAAKGIALGQSAVANNSGDIAIGESSSTSTKHTVSDIKIGDATLSKGVAATDNGTVSFGKDNVKRQIQNVGAGEISETSSDVITGSQLYYVIKAADEIAKTEYTFKVNGVDKKIMRNNGTSAANNANNTLDFKAGYGLEVAYENNAVTYKLNDDSKNSIIEAKNAATTVTNSLQEINRSVARAETAASAASKSATSAASAASAASNSATSAASAASAASNSATAADNSAQSAASAASAASNSATAADNSAQSAASAASAASNSATAADNSAQSAASAASAASNSATAADNSAQSAASAASAASNSATAADKSAQSAASAASAASNSATAADNSAQSAASAASAASNSATAADNSAQSAASAASAASNSATAANSAASAAQISAQRIEDSGLISKDGKTASAANNTSNRDSAKAKGKDATAVGYGSNASGENATALGNNSQASANNATAIGQNAKAKAENAVAIGQGSVANEKDTVSVGNDGSNGQPIVNRRITNVATPIHNTDAVNKQYVDNSVNSVRNELKQTDKKLRGGIAGAVAMANIPTVNRAGGTMIGLGVGNFKGQNAVAVGMSKSSDNNRIHFKVSGSATSAGDYAVGGGIGYQW